MIKSIQYLFAIGFILGFMGCKKQDHTTHSGVAIIKPSGNEKYLTQNADILFDQNAFHTFELNLPEQALDYIDSDPSAEEYVEGSLTFNGETISPIGIRYKGSVGAFAGALSDFNGLKPSGHKIATKLSMKIKIDWKGYHQTFYGLKKLQFHALNNDPTLMHDRLGYWLFRQMGVPAPRAVHVKLYINGKYYGVFGLIEQIDEQFAKHNFPTESGGNIYKEIWPLKSNGKAQSDDALSERLTTNRIAGTTTEIMRSFAKAVVEADDQTLQSVIQERMDLDKILAYIAVDRSIKNDDGAFHWYCFGPFCGSHNFYWYEAPNSRKLHLIPWDLDHAFANIMGNEPSIITIGDEWGETSENCEPYYHDNSEYKQRSAACDKLTGGWASFETEYAEMKSKLINGPLSITEADHMVDLWVNQIQAAITDAHLLHDDAISPEAWLYSIQALKEQLAYARTH